MCAVDDGVDFVGIADAKDDEVGGFGERGGRIGGGGAGGVRLRQRLGAEIAGGDLVAVLDQMLEHRVAHAPDPHDPDAFLGACGHH